MIFGLACLDRQFDGSKTLLELSLSTDGKHVHAVNAIERAQPALVQQICENANTTAPNKYERSATI